MIGRALRATSIAEAAFVLAAGHVMFFAGGSDRVGLLVGLPGLLLVLFGWPALVAAVLRWDSRPLSWSGWYVELAVVASVSTLLLLAESALRPSLAVAVSNARVLVDVQSRNRTTSTFAYDCKARAAHSAQTNVVTASIVTASR